MIKNLTPHPINIVTVAGRDIEIPSHGIARAATHYDSAPEVRSGPGTMVPTSFVRLGAVEGLPGPEVSPGTYYVVSIVAAQAAAAQGRPMHDILTPGDAVRDERGAVVGCRTLVRWQKQPQAAALTLLSRQVLAAIQLAYELGRESR